MSQGVACQEALYCQDFDEDDDVVANINNGAWKLVQFNIDPADRNSRDKALTRNLNAQNNRIKFDVKWTKDKRNLTDEENCESNLEVGTARAYGMDPSQGNVAELDSDLSKVANCGYVSQEAANVALRTKIETQPGYKYKLSFKYAERSYSNTAAHKNLVVRFGDEINGFNGATQLVEENVVVTAKNNFTRLVFRDTGKPDTYGMILDDIKIVNIGKDDKYDDWPARISLDPLDLPSI